MHKPCMANLVPGGKTPVLPAAQLQEIGYKLALYPVMLLSSAIAAMQATLTALQPGSKAPAPASVSFVDLQGIVGFPAYWDQETRYQAKD
jgi:2-methylisocitrate lyase-like PEP mutase family enzyme